MFDSASTALRVVNHISAMVAYWDANQRCVFANGAYREWFGRSPHEMSGISMQQLLGPLYLMNLPHIQGALRGGRQVFERRIELPDGRIRETIATYTPDNIEGRICGFSAHVADVTSLKEREVALIRAVQERDGALAAVKTLEGLLPICAGCKNIRDTGGHWHSVENYVSQHSSVNFSHGMCPRCVRKYYPDLF